MGTNLLSKKIFPQMDAELLMNNIPGGVFSCQNDFPYTLVQVNDGFLSMVGYTWEEICQTFQGSLLEMVDLQDRSHVFHPAVNADISNGELEREYRIIRKDGTILWVLEKSRQMYGKDGQQYLFGVLIDVTEKKQQEEKLRRSLERHQIIMNQTADIIFDWDMVQDVIVFSENWNKTFGYPSEIPQFRQHLEDPYYATGEDREFFSSFMESIENGCRKYGEVEIRIGAKDKELWCRMRVTGLSNEEGKVIRAVGSIVNIDDEKRKAQKLLDQAQRDMLTKLYNKEACREQVEALLEAAEPNSQSALMIIDLDNFKQVNDTKGHLFGDVLLTQIAQILQKQFRSQDIVARVGGDEFVVFLNNIPGEEIAERKASQIVEAVKQLAAHKFTEGKISCSVGIALYPSCGDSYNQLFEKADQALYQAKNLGKDQYFRFNPQEGLEGYLTMSSSTVGGRIDSEESHMATDSWLIESIFHILYQASSIDTAIYTILDAVGKQFDASRIYIFENKSGEDGCFNTYSWYDSGMQDERNHLFQISYQEDIGQEALNLLKNESVCYCRDLSNQCGKAYDFLKRQGVKSTLQCAILDQGKLKGFIGFDECRENHFWTEKQVNMLALIAKIISVFLLKDRAENPRPDTVDRSVQ